MCKKSWWNSKFWCFTIIYTKDMAENNLDGTVASSTTEANVSDKRCQPIEGRCQFFMERKRRFCRTVPPKDRKYCVEHSHALGEITTKKRIPCPLDPKHTCYEDQLKKHLKKCNARESAQPAFYKKNINLGSCAEEDKSLKVAVGSVPAEEVLQMVDRVKVLYSTHVPEVREEVTHHDALREELDNPMNGDMAKKHLNQQSSLVAHMEKLGLLRDGLCYIEFGAGKGGLSHWVQKATPLCHKNKYLLVEKGCIRYKMDSFHKAENQGPNFERLRIDIQNLCLHKVDTLRDNKELPIVGMGKHLCGGATDLMLRCLMQQARNKAETTIGQVEALVLALCCHHRCDWQTYTGKDFFTELGLGAREFYLIASMTSWATCATRTLLNKLAEKGKEETDQSEGKTVKRSADESDTSETKKCKIEQVPSNVHETETDDTHDASSLLVSRESTEETSSIDAGPAVVEDGHMPISDHAPVDVPPPEEYFHPRYGTLTPEDREEVGYQCKKLIDMGRLHYVEKHGFSSRLVKYTTNDFSLENVALLATSSS